jgi:hypothetical protein
MELVKTRVKMNNSVFPKCVVCGHDLPVSDVQFDPETGDEYAIVKPCPDKSCIMELSKDRINPKFFVMGGAR